MRCEERFESIYGRSAEGLAFCPYRICPVGAHIDHQHGRITGLAIDRGVNIAYRAKQNGVVEMVSLQFEKRAQWHIAAVPERKEGDWADYLRGATLALSRKYTLRVGVCGVIEGNLPIGGLSSSAAVTIAFLSALCRVNDIHPTEGEMIAMAMSAENDYVGVSSGKLDQSCEILARRDHLLYLDTKDDSYELIPSHKDMKPYRIGVFFSGLERSLAGTKYNQRVDECRSAAFALLSYDGGWEKKLSDTRLRDVPYELFEKYGDRLPEAWRRRVVHWYEESQRVELAAEAWRRGDVDSFGRLMLESGESSIVNYEAGSEELRRLHDILRTTDGVYGGRFSGAGFKGCCVALIDPAFEESVTERVRREYLRTFPALSDKYSAHICVSADGVNW